MIKIYSSVLMLKKLIKTIFVKTLRKKNCPLKENLIKTSIQYMLKLTIVICTTTQL